MHQYITRGIPQFVAEVAKTLDTADIELDIASGGSQRVVGKTQCISAVGRYAGGKFPARLLLDLFGQLGLHQAGGAFGDQRLQLDTINQVDGVEHITLGFGHFLPMCVTNQAVHIDGVKGRLTAKMQAHHDHAATQKKMISKPVTSTEVGWNVFSSAVSSGQPKVENDHRAEENQVSSTSSSWRSSSSASRWFSSRIPASLSPT